MKIHSSIALFVLLIFTSFSSFGQATNENSNPLDNGSINDQFDYAINKSSKYEEYRVIKSYWMSRLKSNTLDSISSLELKIDELQQNTARKQQKIDSLTNLLQETKVMLEKSITNKNSLTFLGIKTSKSTYQNITFSIIVILIVGLILLFLVYKKSLLVTNETKKTLSELQDEFDAHRKRSLEREKTMARNHLNELNKLRNK